MMFIKEIKWKDILVASLILGVTFGYYLIDDFFKMSDILQDFHEITSLVYYSKMKILIIVLSMIWYFTCSHWWKSSILIIISIELLKLISIFNPNQSHIDEIEFYISLPITIPIILLLIFISKKINEYNLALEVRSKIDNEIDEIFFALNQDKKNNLMILKQKYIEVQKIKSLNENSVDYLSSLIKMRDEFYKI